MAVVRRTERSNLISMPPLSGSNGCAPWRRNTDLAAPSDTEVKLASKAPLDSAARHHDAGNMVAELLLKRRPPRHQLESETVINHRKPARRQHHPLTECPGDVFTVTGRAMREASLVCKLRRGGIELTPPQSAMRSRANTTRCPFRRASPTPAR